MLKKYPNRRLYDTQSSSYITLADVKQMVMEGDAFVVRDAKSGEDLTRSILLQIILEEETGGVPIFSTQMLSQIIRFYGHAMQGMMGSYLEKNLQTFTDIQQRIAEQSKGLYDPKAMNPSCGRSSCKARAPAMQGLMGNYLEQSKAMFMQMQEQMAKQAETLFPGMGALHPPALIAQPSTTGSFAQPPTGEMARSAGCCASSVIDAVATSNSRSRMRICSVASRRPADMLADAVDEVVRRVALRIHRVGSPNTAASRFAEVQLSFTRAPSGSATPPIVTGQVVTRRLETKGSSMRRISSMTASNSASGTPARSRLCSAGCVAR